MRVDGRKLYYEALHILYCSPDIIEVIILRQMRWAGHVARTGGEEKCSILMGKPEGERPLGRPKSRCEHNIKLNLKGNMEGVVLDSCGSG